MLDERLDLAAVNDALDGSSLDVVQEVIPDDPMYVYSPEQYFQAGARALRCTRLALLAAERDGALSILDFACGGGRVLRYLKAAFPEAQLTACDIFEKGIDFCAEHLGARPLLSSPNLEETDIGGPYDLIWVGSLFTHVGSRDWSRLLSMFEEALSPGGVLVFTAYGRGIADMLRTRQVTLDLEDDHIEQILEDFDAQGFGFFADFRPDMDHGDALAARRWVCGELDRFASLKLLYYTEGAWLNQDVIACVKSPQAA